jgi:hypothetical protein
VRIMPNIQNVLCGNMDKILVITWRCIQSDAALWSVDSSPEKYRLDSSGSEYSCWFFLTRCAMKSENFLTIWDLTKFSSKAVHYVIIMVLRKLLL